MKAPIWGESRLLLFLKSCLSVRVASVILSKKLNCLSKGKRFQSKSLISLRVHYIPSLLCIPLILCRERQPGDGEADADEDKSIRTVYSHSYHTRSASSCSTALTVQSDADSASDDDGVGDDANLGLLPIKKMSKSTYQPRSRSRSSSGCRSVLDDDDDVTNIASDSDSDTTIDTTIDDPAICDLDPPASSLSRREKSRSLPTLSSDSDVDDDDDDDDDDSDEKRRSAASRRSRSVSRLSNVASDSLPEKTKDLPRPRSAAAISFTTLTERYARKNAGKKGKSPLMPSQFDNVPPCIRFVIDGQKSESFRAIFVLLGVFL